MAGGHARAPWDASRFKEPQRKVKRTEALEKERMGTFSMDEIIVGSFGSQIANGMTVYDANGDKIGTVQQYDLTNGWFQTEKGVLVPRDRYIPFSAIDRVGPSGIYLSVTKDYVEVMYDQPPFVDVDV